MFTLLVMIVVIALALLALVWVGTAWAQGYFYDAPTDGLHWRAPAAAGAVALFLLVWTILEYARPNTTDTLFRFSTQETTPFDHFISVRKNEEGKEEEIPYEGRRVGNRLEFRDAKGNVWARSSSGMMVAIILEETPPGGGDKVRHRFNAQLDKSGKFAPRESRGIEQALRYHEEDGSRFIISDELGKAYRYRSSRLILNVFVNGLHFVLWFVVLWLLLRFQWPHALGFGLVCWLVLTLALLPYVLGKARDASEQRDKPKAVAMSVVRSDPL